MTDIYIRRNKSSRGCLRLILLLCAIGALALVGVLGVVRARRSAEEAPPAEPSPVLETTAPAMEPADVRTVPVTDPGSALLQEARAQAEAGDLSSARASALAVLDQSRYQPARRGAEDLLSEISIDLVLSPRAMPEKVDYTIKSGDTLGALAKRFDTTVDLIRKSNQVSGSLIRVGDRYRILHGTFSIRVDRSENDLVLYLNDRFFKRYAVGTGKFEKTPIGEFKITDRIAQPTWWRPDGKAIPFGDEENVLGTHWLSLNLRGYGIHGTWEPDTIGKQASAGCIRLVNADIEELYTLVPVGTAVAIVE